MIKLLQSILKDNLLIFFFLLYLLGVKIYFIFINPAKLESFIVAVNSLIFFNAKSFFIQPQSFMDWNHPGTPVYYITNLIFYFKNFQLEDIDLFLKIFHNITFLITIFSSIYFYNYFKKFINKKLIISFLFFFISFEFFLFSLEVVDYNNFKFPLALIMIVEFIKLINKTKTKNIYILSFLIALSNSIILSFIVITIPIFISVILIILKNKKIKFFLHLIFANIFFLILFNFPILGRLPKIIYNVFLRHDVRIDFGNLGYAIQNIFKYFYLNQSYIYFIVIIAIVFFFFQIKKVKFKNLNNYTASLITLIFSLIFFLIYSLLAAGSANFDIKHINLRGIGLRNVYLTNIFIFLLFLLNNKFFLKYKNLVFNSVLIFFIISNLIYFEKRNIYLNNLKIKDSIFKNIVKNKFSNNDQLITFSDIGYGFGEFNFLSIANYVYAGEKFNSEFYNLYPRLYFLRIYDIDFFLEKKTFKINPLVIKLDKIIKNLFPDKLHLILSPNSLNYFYNAIGSEKRSKKVFLSKNNQKPKGVIFNYSKKINNVEKIINYIKTELNFKNVDKVLINDDLWFFIY